MTILQAEYNIEQHISTDSQYIEKYIFIHYRNKDKKFETKAFFSLHFTYNTCNRCSGAKVGGNI